MSERSTAFRRHKMFVKKKEALQRLIRNSIEPDRRLIGIRSRSPRGVTHALCGNPRRYYGQKTVQERKAEPRLEVRDEDVEIHPPPKTQN